MNNELQKICILIPNLMAGGSERVAAGMADFFSNSYDVSLITFTNQPDFYFLSNRVERFFLSDSTSSDGKNRFISRVIAFRKICRKIKPDIVVSFLPIANSVALLASIGHGQFVIGHERSNPYKFSKYHIKSFVKGVTALFMNGFVFQTNRARAFYSKAIKHKSAIIPNPIVNTNIPEEICKERKNIITSMGRLIPAKGYDVLINAFAKIEKKYKSLSLVIYGEGEYRPVLETLINKIGLREKILLPGNDSTAIKKISESKAFVFTSRSEGMPNALLESMAAGVPCISTDCLCGPSELIDNGINGLLVPVDDVDAIAEAMDRILSNKNFAKKLAHNAYKIRENHSLDRIFKDYEKYFVSVINNRKNNIFVKG